MTLASGRVRSWLAALALAGASAATAAADWPARVFAPYFYVGAGNAPTLWECLIASGQRYFTLAFIIAGPDGRLAWDGRLPVAGSPYAGDIAAIRSQGGDVILSFGGEAGVEAARRVTDPGRLEAMYRDVVDRYAATWLDFDIEGDGLEDRAANVRRNTALARLQAERPGLIISYTLPVDPKGLDADSRALLANAHAHGVVVHSVNLMTMDFGARFSRGRRMEPLAVASALAAEPQCASIDPSMEIGLTPMIGRNDEPGEIFTEEDARALRAWADAHPWIGTLSFWSINRDTGRPGRSGNAHSGVGQSPWAFTKIFQSFGSAADGG